MRIALLNIDNREPFREHHKTAPWFGTAPQALLQGFARLPEVEVHVVSCLRRPVTSPEKLAPNVWYHSLLVPKIGWMSTLYQGCIRATRHKVRELRPDVVHGQGTEYDGAISAVFTGYPNVVTIHGNVAELARLFKARVGSFNWLAARLENFALPRTGGVFCNSRYTESLVAPRAKRTWLVPNAVRESFFRPVAADGSRPKCAIVNVGIISPRKRQLELLNVVRQLRDLKLDFEFQFIGRAVASDPYAAAFLQQIQPLEAGGFARYLGEKTAVELIDCFDQAAGAVHFPSEEAFGLVVAEAMARGLKFFGSRLGGIVEISQDAPGAELHDAEDWAGLEAGIARWLRAGFPRSPAAAALMRERYHPEVIARRHVEIYREVLSTRS